jgi:hypothetical protein
MRAAHNPILGTLRYAAEVLDIMPPFTANFSICKLIAAINATAEMIVYTALILGLL